MDMVPSPSKSSSLARLANVGLANSLSKMACTAILSSSPSMLQGFGGGGVAIGRGRAMVVILLALSHLCEEHAFHLYSSAQRFCLRQLPINKKSKQVHSNTPTPNLEAAPKRCSQRKVRRVLQSPPLPLRLLEEKGWRRHGGVVSSLFFSLHDTGKFHLGHGISDGDEDCTWTGWMNGCFRNWIQF